MPKKTKKHKLQARGRRKPLVLRVPTQQKTAIQRNNTQKAIAVDEPILSTKKHTSVFSNSSESTIIFKQDLSKSMIITAVLIIIQIGLFVSSQANFFDISSVIRF